MMMSPLRILTLYRQLGFVHTHALNWIDAPWLPKSDSGTRSPAPHFRHRGNSNSTPISPSFSSAPPLQVSSARPRRHSARVPLLAELPPQCPLLRKARLMPIQQYNTL